jgi:hypothetical protein
MPVCKIVGIFTTKSQFIDLLSAISDKDHDALTVISMSTLESVFRTNTVGHLILT